MVKKKHKEYKLENLKENKDTAIGPNRMVDPNVNPNTDSYDYNLKHGIDDKKHNGKKRWTIDAYDWDNSKGNLKGTPKMKMSELKQIIKEVIQEEMGNAFPKDIQAKFRYPGTSESILKYN